MITKLAKNLKDIVGIKTGYGTQQHLKAIKNLGVTSHHRKIFHP